MTDQRNPQIRCRFAPSPTGSLHVGGARTALFNYLFAKQSGGTFVLRIEDTDLQRSTEDAVTTIMSGLEWLGIVADEGPFFQSQRFDIYQQYAKRLLEIGAAYPCTCSAETLEQVREEQRKNNQKPQYNRLHRPKEAVSQPTTLPTGQDKEPFVIRLRTPESGIAVFEDLIIGKVETPLAEIDDFIILRSDGSPTYNFTVVVDDIDMKISHVIRGMDHVSNTPKQLVIYQALNAELPIFAHVPMILGSDKKKLSKRHGATSVFEYKKDGYLSSAFVNYLARLGWSHGDQEIFTQQELEKLFTLEQVGKSSAVFDTTKLIWVNSEHLKAKSAVELLPLVREWLAENSQPLPEADDQDNFLKLIVSLKERTKTLNELSQGCLWYLLGDDQLRYDDKAVSKHLTEKTKPLLSSLLDKLKTCTQFNEKQLEELFHQVITEAQVKLADLAQAVRVAACGTNVSPPIYTVLELLGKERSLRRLHRAVEMIAG